LRGIREWIHRLLSTLGPRRSDDDLAEELRLHAELAAEGGRPGRVKAGGSLQAMEALRDQRGLPWLDTFLRDLRFGLRTLGRSPVFTVVAVLSLALGIGANAAIFHLIDNVRLRRLPVANAHELVEIRLDGPEAFGNYEGTNARATYPLWDQIRSHQQAFSGVFAWGDADFIVGRGAEGRQARGLWVSGEFFPVLGVAPERGRLFGAADDRHGCGPGPAVISHGFWQSHFGGADSAIGSTLAVFEQTFTVVGVAPPTFTGLEVGRTFDIALPLCSAELVGYDLAARDRWWLTVMGRRKPDWTMARASEHLRTLSPGVLDATLAPGYGAELSEAYRKLQLSAIPAGRGVSRLRDTFGLSLTVLLGLTGLLLLITCGNLATLMLARASARQHEIAVRAALGASRTRLVSQMVTESLLVAAAGALVAVPAAVVAGRALVAFIAAVVPVELKLDADWRLFVFVAATAALTTVIFGLFPAWRASMLDPLAAMRLTSRGTTIDRRRARFQRGLVAAQVALSLVLVVTALMFVQTFRNLAAVNTGFSTDGTKAVYFFDVGSRGLAAEQMHAFQTQLAGAIRAVPGVQTAASATHAPLSGSFMSHFFRLPRAAKVERKASRFAYVDAEYFDTLDIPVKAGREFTDRDTMQSPRVAVVNESFVRSHLDGVNPVGEVVTTFPEPGFPETTYEIVGVAGDTKYADLRDEDCWCDAGGGTMPPLVYIPFAQNPRPFAWAPVLVRVSAEPSLRLADARSGQAGITQAITGSVARLNPGIAVQVIDLDAFIQQRLTGDRIVAWLAGAFGVLAMILVIVGLYGLIAYLAVGRRNEIGVRLSLGATRAQIVRLVVRDSLWMLGIGVGIGLPIAAAVAKAAEALLFGVSALDAATLAGATLLLAAAAVLAGGIPARRASRLDPNVVLRGD
jgi:predicted permease